MGVLGRPAKVGNPAPILTCRAVAYEQHAQCVESSNGSMVWGCVGWGCGVVRGHVGVQQQRQQRVGGRLRGRDAGSSGDWSMYVQRRWCLDGLGPTKCHCTRVTVGFTSCGREWLLHS